MDSRELWAVTFLGHMKDRWGDGGEVIIDTFTVHVVTDKGYQSAIDAAKRAHEKDWSLELRRVAHLGAAPLVVE